MADAISQLTQRIAELEAQLMASEELAESHRSELTFLKVLLGHVQDDLALATKDLRDSEAVCTKQLWQLQAQEREINR